MDLGISFERHGKYEDPRFNFCRDEEEMSRPLTSTLSSRVVKNPKKKTVEI